MGIVIPFPNASGARFTPAMRDTLQRFATTTLGALPVAFGVDGDGREFCCLANGLMIGWDRRCRLILTDTNSGFVDRGPFSTLDEIFLLVAYLAA
jgi:hypothetical protein